MRAEPTRVQTTMPWRRRIVLAAAFGAGSLALGLPVAAGVATPWGEVELAAGTLLGIVLAVSTLTAGSAVACLWWRPIAVRTAAGAFAALGLAAASLASLGGSPVAAIAEEALFRGLPIALMLKWGSRRSLVVVAVVSAVAFAVVHPDPWSLYGANRLAFGIVCFVLAVRTSHLGWAATLHLASNAGWRLVPAGAEAAGHVGDLALLVLALVLVRRVAPGWPAPADAPADDGPADDGPAWSRGAPRLLAEVGVDGVRLPAETTGRPPGPTGGNP